MAELPQPAELPRDLVSVVGPINFKAREFSYDLRMRISRILGQDRRNLSLELLGWLSIVLVVPVLIYGAAELAQFGMEMPSEPTRSKLEADYGEWAFVEIRRVKPEILDEIQKDRPDEIMVIGALVHESGSAGIYGSVQEPKGGGSQSVPPISPTPSPTEAVSTPSTTTTESSTPNVTPTLTSTPAVAPTITPMATHTPVPTSMAQPTATSMPTIPLPTEEPLVTICHKPGEHQKTLSVPESEVLGHLGHGDYLGVCNES